MEQISRMQQEMNEMQEHLVQAHQMKDKVQNLVDNGIIKVAPNGNFQPVVDPAESEHIRS